MAQRLKQMRTSIVLSGRKQQPKDRQAAEENPWRASRKAERSRNSLLYSGKDCCSAVEEASEKNPCANQGGWDRACFRKRQKKNAATATEWMDRSMSCQTQAVHKRYSHLRKSEQLQQNGPWRNLYAHERGLHEKRAAQAWISLNRKTRCFSVFLCPLQTIMRKKWPKDQLAKEVLSTLFGKTQKYAILTEME